MVLKKLTERLGQKALHCVEAEKAHQLGIKALSNGLYVPSTYKDPANLAVEVAGLKFKNPLGIAAGFDKNAEAPDAMLNLGMGFAEIGTVTPKPQSGNPRPRVFRLSAEKGVINRLGFNNDGHEVVYERMVKLRRKLPLEKAIIGVNIGANKTSDDFVADYVQGIHKFADVASYFTVNISSPNTPGLRDLQAAEALRVLLQKVLEAREEQVQKLGRALPTFLKIAPDIDAEAIKEIVGEVRATSLDGMIVSNTTISRTSVPDSEIAREQGGLSGKPLFDAATRVLAEVRRATGDDFPLIGVGGLHDGASAINKMKAGANLLQIYSGLVYGGFSLIEEIKQALSSETKRSGLTSVSELTGTSNNDWQLA